MAFEIHCARRAKSYNDQTCVLVSYTPKGITSQMRIKLTTDIMSEMKLRPNRDRILVAFGTDKDAGKILVRKAEPHEWSISYALFRAKNSMGSASTAFTLHHTKIKTIFNGTPKLDMPYSITEEGLLLKYEPISETKKRGRPKKVASSKVVTKKAAPKKRTKKATRKK